MVTLEQFRGGGSVPAELQLQRAGPDQIDKLYGVGEVAVALRRLRCSCGITVPAELQLRFAGAVLVAALRYRSSCSCGSPVKFQLKCYGTGEVAAAVRQSRPITRSYDLANVSRSPVPSASPRALGARGFDYY